jgi:hypothetical protein
MSGGGQPSQGKPSPDGPPQGSGGPQERERTPESPGGDPEKPGESQQGKGEKPDQPAQDGDPKSPRESKDDPRNEKGGPPPGLETSRASQDRSNERWGDLPETVRDLFRTEGGGEMPAEYRDWIDAYYRRLNRERR